MSSQAPTIEDSKEGCSGGQIIGFYRPNGGRLGDISDSSKLQKNQIPTRPTVWVQQEAA